MYHLGVFNFRNWPAYENSNSKKMVFRNKENKNFVVDFSESVHNLNWIKACNREFSFFPTMLQLHYLHLYIKAFCDPSTSSLHGMPWRNNCKTVCLLTTSHPSILDTNWMPWHPNTSPATFSRTQMIDSRTNRLAWNGKTKSTAVGTGSPTWPKERIAVQIPLPNWGWERHFPPRVPYLNPVNGYSKHLCLFSLLILR